MTTGKAVLRENGVEVIDFLDGPSAVQLEAVVALLVGYDRVDAQMLDRLPSLRLLVTHSAGVDMVDVDEVSRRRLWLANVPDGATDEVASHAIAMAMALIRRLAPYDRQVRMGGWDSEALPLPRVPGELTCGVVGMGRIGRRFADLAGGLFDRVVGFDAALPSEAWPGRVHRCPRLEDLLQAADCVSLHLPLTPETRHLIDAGRLAMLPPGALLVNASRGELVDTTALVHALASGHLGGAACDVLEEEPPPSGAPLLDRDDVLLSPHVAYLSATALRRYADSPAQNVLAFLRDGRPLNPVVIPQGGPAESTSP